MNKIKKIFKMLPLDNWFILLVCAFSILLEVIDNPNIVTILWIIACSAWVVSAGKLKLKLEEKQNEH